MKRIAPLLALFLLFAASAHSQMQLVTVQKGANVSYYHNLPTAVEAAEPGANIYIPGNFSPCSGDINIEKELHFYGAGHYPNHTSAVGRTDIGYNMNFKAGSSNSTVTGIKLNGVNIYCDSINPVDNIHVSRCIMGGASGPNATNVRFSETVFTHYVSPFNGAVFEKCIFSEVYASGGFGYVLFDHCIFYSARAVLSECNNCLIRNSIFFSANGLFNEDYKCHNNILMNNVFADSIDFPIPKSVGDNFGYNNLFNQDPATVFVSYTVPGFSYDNDYHIRPDSPAKAFVTTDGTEVGIYGTAWPYKDGSLPVTPHITDFQAGNELIDGKINVNVTVEAQTK